MVRYLSEESCEAVRPRGTGKEFQARWRSNLERRKLVRSPCIDSSQRYFSVPHRAYSQQEVVAICGLSRSTVYAYTKRGEFPARVKITRHASAWVREEVLAWVESRIHASRRCPPTPAENRETGFDR
ncbi:helix-turn-helix transcriptional regulator [Duganella sp. CT11-25]|uniref:helix-turn-helix transcriptional regulator n=1 Tax=unclassified Duganella TaxID=2636909 RepID=UPI0039AEC9AC